jgi:hypothetical protein
MKCFQAVTIRLQIMNDNAGFESDFRKLQNKAYPNN